MTSYDSESLLELAEPLEPAVQPQVDPSPSIVSPPEAAHSDLQSRFGNSLLAAAVSGGLPPGAAQGLPWQNGLGNTTVSRTLIQRKANDIGQAGEAGAIPPATPT